MILPKSEKKKKLIENESDFGKFGITISMGPKKGYKKKLLDLYI